ncbi:MAG: histone deacetylase family protein [Halofilum sp. (in: g-proteobacteria)]|nr:histone deacetylase family protein [Halofilum sp. (in: g-proteobacteria)]
MKVYYAPIQKTHDPDTFLVAGAQRPIPEVPERAERLLAALERLGLVPEAPGDHGLGPIAAVHTPEYLDFLQTIAQQWQSLGGSREVVPNVHPDRRDCAYPASPVGRAGYHLGDTACPVAPETWDAVRTSAHAAVSAARAVRDGDTHAYALCRPPGHHAFADMAGGFCYLNNAAIAAAEMRARHARVAVLDIDLHHGNGTQGVFYARDDVLTVSVHVDPDDFYPFFWGHAGERGRGRGLGYNLNLPLALGSGDDAFLEALAAALRRVHAYAPGALVLSLGLDASADDPFGGLRVTPDGFEAIGRRIGALDLPVVLVQEGGYLSDTLGENLFRFLTGFTGAR